MVKLLVLGPQSQVGAALVELITGRDDVCCESVQEALLCPAAWAEVADCITAYQPTLVVNCHTYTLLESENGIDSGHLAFLQQLAELLVNNSIGLIQLSSDQALGPGLACNEDEIPQPQSEKGQRLLQVEQLLLAHLPQSLILRTSWIFGQQGVGIFEYMLQVFEQGRTMYVQPDMVGAPTPAPDAARVIVALALQLAHGAPDWGVYHYCCSDTTNSREFAETVLALTVQYGGAQAEKVQLVDVEQVDFHGLEQHRLLECDKIRDNFGIKQRPWRSALTAIIKRRYQR